MEPSLSLAMGHRDSNMVKAEMLANWLNIYQRTSRGISQWFEEHQFRRVNLYGMGNLGQLLGGELTSADFAIRVGKAYNLITILRVFTTELIKQLSTVSGPPNRGPYLRIILFIGVHLCAVFGRKKY